MAEKTKVTDRVLVALGKQDELNKLLDLSYQIAATLQIEKIQKDLRKDLLTEAGGVMQGLGASSVSIAEVGNYSTRSGERSSVAMDDFILELVNAGVSVDIIKNAKAAAAKTIVGPDSYVFKPIGSSD